MEAKKKEQQKEKKRRREEEDDEKDTGEINSLGVKEGEKVFMETRTGKAHYLQIIKDIKYIKEIKNSVSKQNAEKQKAHSNKEIDKSMEKDKEIVTDKEKDNLNRRASHPSATPVESRGRAVKIRRELSYPPDSQGKVRPQDKVQQTQKRLEVPERRERGSVSSKKKKKERLSSTDLSARKKRKNKQSEEENGDQPELWSKIIGRREKKQNRDREEAHKRNEKEDVRTRKRKPLKTSAVVITVGDQQTSYSEVLAWARQSIKLSDDEMKALTTK